MIREKVKYKGYFVFPQHKFLSGCGNINCGCRNITPLYNYNNLIKLSDISIGETN